MSLTEKIVEACQCELHAHSEDDQSHNRVTMSCRRLPPPLARDPPRATSTIATHITATAMVLFHYVSIQ
jgi:hypothetical protein